MTEPNLTLEYLTSRLSYCPETGEFRWRAPKSNRVKAGDIAGGHNGNGYIRISIDGRYHYAHRLAWMFVNGAMPDCEIDHADGNRSNNRIANLRPAQHYENSQNQPLRSTNTSGRHGVSWSKPHSRWAAYIMFKGRKRHLGLFDSVDEAGEAYVKAKSQLHLFQPVPRDVVRT